MHTRHRAFISVVGFVLGAAVLPAQAANGSCLANLHGTWRGTGSVLGRPIVMEQHWEPAMRGSFTELTMRHLATDSSTVAQFEGRGFYRARAGSDSVTGTWFDARGLTHNVAGACRDTVFSSHWTGSEHGRTIYAWRADELTVIDSIFPTNGAPREFGRTILRKVGSP